MKLFFCFLCVFFLAVVVKPDVGLSQDIMNRSQRAWAWIGLGFKQC